ncbi:MAG TPA: hypothetical protein VK427_18290 [Kofleriaceae bacterium]|nr:hypothetical protein [Kofleriaceae bacterium]
MKTILFSILLAAACGGGAKKPAAAPTEPTPTPTETTTASTPEPTPAPTAAPSPAPEEPKADPDAGKKLALAAELAAFEKAKPVFVRECRSCHVKGQRNASAKKLEEFEMTTYPFTGEHNTAKDIREVLAIGGGKPSMPKNKPGSIKGADLAVIAAWADAYDAAEAAGAHEKK